MNKNQTDFSSLFNKETVQLIHGDCLVAMKDLVKKGIKGYVPKLYFNSIHKRYLLTNPEITLAFECKEDALKAVEQPIYVGQTEFILYPNGDVMEMTEEDFDKITGFECFSSNKEDPEAIYVGNNRQRNNERMYVKIKYTE